MTIKPKTEQYFIGIKDIKLLKNNSTSTYYAVGLSGSFQDDRDISFCYLINKNSGDFISVSYSLVLSPDKTKILTNRFNRATGESILIYKIKKDTFTLIKKYFYGFKFTATNLKWKNNTTATYLYKYYEDKKAIKKGTIYLK